MTMCSLEKVAVVMFVFAISSNVPQSHAFRSNGRIRRCGNNAKEFLQWFCRDDSFTFPYSTHSGALLTAIFGRYRFGDKGAYPFVRLAVDCCKYGCLDSEYMRMCDYHKKIKRCERRMQYRKRDGRRRRHCTRI